MPVTPETVHPFAGRKYIHAVGRRKSASATVELYASGSGKFIVNRKSAETYFGNKAMIELARMSILELGRDKEFDINVKTNGGGPAGQAEAIRLALARALVKLDEGNKPMLRQAGFLTVDARVKERKKPGKKRARRSPQWSKR